MPPIPSFFGSGLYRILSSNSPAHFNLMKKSGLRIRIRIRIRIGLDPDSIGSVDPDPDPESRSGSRRAKMTHKSRKFGKSSCFEVLDGLFSELKASSVTWTFFYGGLGIGKL
jgi:hypothetical protein